MDAATAPADTVGNFVGDCLRRQPASLRLERHQIDFAPAGPVLVVSFEPASLVKLDLNFDRPAWGQGFIQKRGHSLLGVKRARTDWYRSAELHRSLSRLAEEGFFHGFEQVMFYGPSMGGYAALSLAALSPGCTVLAMNPQSTMAPDRVWFDQRFAGERQRVWQGRFVDGVDGARVAFRVYACYDPYQVKDRLHVDRLPSHNLVRLRLPFAGHTTAQALNALGVLGRVFDEALAGTLTEPGFRELARARASLADYQFRLAERGVWPPRRMRHLERALEADPGHAPAQALRDALATPAPRAGEGSMPRRWPSGVVTAARVPLVYLNLPKCAGTTIQNHLLFMASGHYAQRSGEIHAHEGLRRSREDNDATHELIARQVRDGALIFTFVRDPGQRAYACFNEKIMQVGPHSFAAIRQTLEQSWGLRPARHDEPTSLELQRENFAAFLRFVRANLAGETPVRQDPHWCPQGPMLVQFRKHFKIGFVGRVENFAADMATVLHRAGVRRLPDVRTRPWRHPPPPYSFQEVWSPDLQALLDDVYAADYKHLGYGDRSRPADAESLL